MESSFLDLWEGWGQEAAKDWHTSPLGETSRELREMLLACALTVDIQPKFLHLLCSSWGLATGIPEVGKV